MRPRRLKSEMNVVPYIDVMLVLLVIFMVAAPMMQTGSIDLPSVGQAAEPPAQPLEVTIKADGELGLRDRAGSGDERLLARNELKSAIAAAQAKNPEQPVLVSGDKNVKYEAVLAVMDELQRQHVKRVGLLVQPTGK
jgi:biopolymer transport protein TolR